MNSHALSSLEDINSLLVYTALLALVFTSFLCKIMAPIRVPCNGCEKKYYKEWFINYGRPDAKCFQCEAAGKGIAIMTKLQELSSQIQFLGNENMHLVQRVDALHASNTALKSKLERMETVYTTSFKESSTYNKDLQKPTNPGTNPTNQRAMPKTTPNMAPQESEGFQTVRRSNASKPSTDKGKATPGIPIKNRFQVFRDDERWQSLSAHDSLSSSAHRTRSSDGHSSQSQTTSRCQPPSTSHGQSPNTNRRPNPPVQAPRDPALKGNSKKSRDPKNTGVNPNETTTLVFGDSLMRGQGTALATRNNGKRTVQVTPGGKIQHIANDILNANIPEGSCVIANVGSNDVFDGGKVPTKEIITKIRCIIALMKSKTRRCVINGIIPRLKGSQYGLNRAKEVNSALKVICEEEDVMFVDTWAAFEGNPSLYGRDGTHLSEAGRILMGDILHNAIFTIFDKPLMDPSEY